jgi:hypothetical protein
MKKNNPVGRPRVPENKRRTKQICISCSPDELKLFLQKQRKLKVKRSELFRRAVINLV